MTELNDTGALVGQLPAHRGKLPFKREAVVVPLPLKKAEYKASQHAVNADNYGCDTRNNHGAKHPKDRARHERGRTIQKLPSARRNGPKWHLSSLNGNQGSWTGSDDVAPDGKDQKDDSGREHKRPQRSAPVAGAPRGRNRGGANNRGAGGRGGARGGGPQRPRPVAQGPDGPQGRQRRPVACFNCHNIGHFAFECPVRHGLVHEREIPLAQLEGVPAAAALSMLQPEAANPLAGDDPRVQRADVDDDSGAPDEKEQPQEDPAAKRLAAISDLRANLVDKAVTMLLTKELASNADRKVVMQNLVQLARKEKMYTLFEDPQEELVNIYASAVKRAFDLRLKTAKDLSISRISDGSVVQTKGTSFSRGVKGLPNKSNSWDKGAVNSRPDMEILGFYETTPIFSLYKIRGLYQSYYYAGLVMRLLFSLFAEKLLHAFLFAVFAVRNSPGHRLFCTPFQPVGYPSTFHPLAGADFFSIGGKLHGPAVEWLETDRQCRGGLTVVAAAIAFVILVSLELVTLTVLYKKWSQRITDGILRVGFHALDALLVIGVVQPFAMVGCDFQLFLVDLPFYLSMLILAVHTVWNVRCLFFTHQPHRCFSIVEALARWPGIYTARCYTDTCLEDVSMKSVRTQTEFKVQRGDSVCKEKVSIFCFWGLDRVIPTIYRSCSHNEKISMDGRVGKLLPAHESPKIFSSIKRNWVNLIRAFDRTLSLIPKSDGSMDFYEWAATFPPKRRDELIRTRVDTHDMPYLTASSFIKREVAPKDSCDLVFKDPRFIQGCPLELSAAVGPSLRLWTKKVRDGLKPTGYSRAEIRAGKQIVYTCGLSNEAIGEAFRASIQAIEEIADAGDEIVFLEDDQSRFDLHLTEGPFKFLKYVYKARLSSRVAKLLERSVSKGRSSLGTRYSIPYTMQSGWPDTSVGDTLVNAAMKSHIHGFGRNWISIICGDDSVTVTTRRELERLGGVDGIVKSYADFGMEVEAKVSTHPLDVEFCSGRFFPAQGSYILFPKVGRILSKIACDTKIRSVKEQAAWLRGIVATLKNFGQVDPVLGALGRGLGDTLSDGKAHVDPGWEHKQFFDGSRTTSEHDINMYYDHHYGSCASQIRNLTSLMEQQRVGQVCQDTLAEHIALIDVA